MESPIQKDGIPAGANPQGPDSKVGVIPEDHPSIHDARSALVDRAVEQEESRRAADNAADGHPVDAAPDPGPDEEDGLAGIRGEEGYVPDRSKPPAKEPEPGLQTQEAMHEPEPAPSSVPEGFEDDPLAEFLVQDADTDEIFFRTVVNGQENLIPLEKARRSLQIHESADQRLQEAAQLRGGLEERERVIYAREKDLQTRLETMHTPPEIVQPSPDAGLSDDEIEARAKEVVAGLFTEDQETASAKLVDLLRETRGASATPINPEEIAQRAVTAAREQLSQEAVNKDVKKGYTKFVENYPDIAADDNLFRYADSLTDTITAEHPDWMPSEVMLEAGKRTSEWLAGLNKTETDPQTPDQPSDRHERKRTLRPIPRPLGGTPEKVPEESPETPADVLADIRASRGQAVA